MPCSRLYDSDVRCPNISPLNISKYEISWVWTGRSTDKSAFWVKLLITYRNIVCNSRPSLPLCLSHTHVEFFHWHFYHAELCWVMPEMDLLLSGAREPKMPPSGLWWRLSNCSQPCQLLFLSLNKRVVWYSAHVCRRAERRMFLKVSATVCSALTSLEANLCGFKFSLSPAWLFLWSWFCCFIIKAFQ